MIVLAQNKSILKAIIKISIKIRDVVFFVSPFFFEEIYLYIFLVSQGIKLYRNVKSHKKWFALFTVISQHTL